MGNSKEHLRVIGVDLGYGFTKCSRMENGRLVLDKYISAVCHLDQKPLEMSDQIFQLGADYYALDTAATKFPRSLLLPLETFEDMMRIYPVWVSYLVSKYGGWESIDLLVLGLSLQWTNRADEMLDHIYSSLNIDRETHRIAMVGQAATCSYIYNLTGLNPLEITAKSQLKAKNYVILDVGTETCDGALVVGGKSTNVRFGLANTGVIRVAYDIVDYIYKMYGLQISVRDAQTLIDSDSTSLIRRGKQIVLGDKIVEFEKKYIENILNLVENQFAEALDQAEMLLICGGGAYIFRKLMKDPEVVDEINKHFSPDFIQIPEASEFYNAISYLRVGEKFLKEELEEGEESK